MPGALAWGYYPTDKIWLPIQVDANGRIKADISAINLGDLGDVSVATPDDGDVLAYSAALGLWIPLTHIALTTGIHGAGSNYLLSTGDISRKNAIINGGFTINQRAYVSAAALAAAAYGHDRWKGGANGGTYSFTQLASPTTITIAANKTLIQVVENKNVYGGTYILSWTGTCQARYAINSATPAGAYASSPITIAGQTAGTTMSVEFGNGASSGTLGLVQLELGSVATPFEFRPYQQELILCLRYYEKRDSSSSFQVFGMGNNETTTTGYGFIMIFPKRIDNCTLSQTGNFRHLSALTVTAITITSSWNSILGGVLIAYTAASGLPLVVGFIQGNNDPSAYLAWSCEL